MIVNICEQHMVNLANIGTLNVRRDMTYNDDDTWLIEISTGIEAQYRMTKQLATEFYRIYKLYAYWVNNQWGEHRDVKETTMSALRELINQYEDTMREIVHVISETDPNMYLEDV